MDYTLSFLLWLALVCAMLIDIMSTKDVDDVEPKIYVPTTTCDGPPETRHSPKTYEGPYPAPIDEAKPLTHEAPASTYEPPELNYVPP